MISILQVQLFKDVEVKEIYDFNNGFSNPIKWDDM